VSSRIDEVETENIKVEKMYTMFFQIMLSKCCPWSMLF
jgi:hypothetical protein